MRGIINCCKVPVCVSVVARYLQSVQVSYRSIPSHWTALVLRPLSGMKLCTRWDMQCWSAWMISHSLCLLYLCSVALAVNTVACSHNSVSPTTPHAHFPYSSPLGMVGHCVSTDSQCGAVGGKSWQLCCHFGSRWSAFVWESYLSGELLLFWLWHCLLVLAQSIPLARTWTHTQTMSVHSFLPFVYI